MQPRRSLRLVVGALVLALPLLTSCGFDRRTNAVYTPSAGTNNRDGVVDVLAAVVVAAQPGSGTFIATLSNSSTEDTYTFEGLAGVGEWQDLTIAEVDPIELPPRGFANLADEGGVHVSGNFGAGDVVSLSLSFDSGDVVDMDVPVVFACDQYADLDTSAGGSSASPGAEEDESSESPTTSGEPYDCAAVLEEE
jgi:hypothetical protein